MDSKTNNYSLYITEPPSEYVEKEYTFGGRFNDSKI